MFNDIVAFVGDLSHLSFPDITVLVSFAVGIGDLVKVHWLRFPQVLLIIRIVLIIYSKTNKDLLSIPKHKDFNLCEHFNFLLNIFGLLSILNPFKSVRYNANKQVEDHHIHSNSYTKVNCKVKCWCFEIEFVIFSKHGLINIHERSRNIFIHFMHFMFTYNLNKQWYHIYRWDQYSHERHDVKKRLDYHLQHATGRREDLELINTSEAHRECSKDKQ